ncbi:metallophosphoesterase [Natrarchaeobaculum sulfurireducens]|uniref:Phosphohydrolase, MPP superfamily n=1 Tax=Natrarchaeobaculum sulfurireducens TaxID=2044521 RepID=A0A346PHQ8_9EURY|nr:metallophosphoesterase [Natrarchaeobaculum sulfurireducens]AXR79053.1 Phosphohydrolase, MPP superfamily [Natrarchaeobaculum sulfurireducens]
MTESVDVPFSLSRRAVYLPAADALVLADVHLGRAAASSVDAPIDDGADVCDRLADVLERTDPATVVVAGDLLHSFDHLPRGTERDLAALESVVEDADASLVVTAGNHDPMLESVFDGALTTEYRLADGGTVVCHGHERPSSEAERYVIGHDHPALSVDGRKLPCFLYGPAAYDGADVLVLPAFTRLAAGATVNRMSASDFQSPLIRDADGFHPAIRDDSRAETLWFPTLGACRRLL